jgi:hypothetical protein
VVFRNNLFGGLELPESSEEESHRALKDPTRAASKAVAGVIEKIHKNTPQIKLSAATKRGVIAELLVILSPRDSIIAVPCAIIPDAKGTFKQFKLDYEGRPFNPVTIQRPVVTTFLDSHHLHDIRNDPGECRWGIVQVLRKTRKNPFGAFHVYQLPSNVYDITPKMYSRKTLKYLGRYYSIPPFEVSSVSWYYEELLRKLGAYMKIKQAVPTNSLCKYYQYRRMPHGAFVALYSYVPDVNEKPPTMKELILANLPAMPTIAEEVATIIPSSAEHPQSVQKTEDKPPTNRGFTLRGGAL